MKFGFDIDDTLINLRQHAFELYNHKLKKNIPLKDFHALKTVEIHEPFGLNATEGKQLWNSLREEIYFTNCPPFPDAIEALNELVRNGHEVYYITARKKQFAEKTKDWMKQAGFPVIDSHFFCGMEDHEKICIIQELQLDYYFDDKPAVLETLQGYTTKLYVKDHPYNQHLEELNRIKEWNQLRALYES
ncbi:HAD family acid phosphatase [Niallia circulans]|uniref:5' nucleotidase, NT5C type n=1 Tax=Niallia circulans TaxID=1397 RepID=UPI001560C7D9|nr:HAD family acid phosphatase [Niallia circulans]NRG31738.1 HAD hydrolase-like protein [Niallia circulans]